MSNPTTTSVDRDLLREQQRQQRAQMSDVRESPQLPVGLFLEPIRVAPSGDALGSRIKQLLGDFDAIRETITCDSKRLIGISRAPPPQQQPLSGGPGSAHEPLQKQATPPNGVRKYAKLQPEPNVVKGTPDIGHGNRRDKGRHRRVNGCVGPQPPLPPARQVNGGILPNGVTKSRKTLAALQPPAIVTAEPQHDQCELDNILKEMKAPAPLTGIPTPNKEGTLFPFSSPSTSMMAKEKERKEKGRAARPLAVVRPHVEDPPSPSPPRPPTPNNVLDNDLAITDSEDEMTSCGDMKKNGEDHRRMETRPSAASSPSSSCNSGDSSSSSESEEATESSLPPSQPESPKEPASWNLSDFMVQPQCAQPLATRPSSSSSSQPPENCKSALERLADSPKLRKPFGKEFTPDVISMKVERRSQSPAVPAPAPKTSARFSATPVAPLRKGFIKKERRKTSSHDPPKGTPRRRAPPEKPVDRKPKKCPGSAAGPILPMTPSTPVYKSKEFVFDSSSSSSRSPCPSPPSPCPSPPSVRDESESECIVDVVNTPSPIKMAPDASRSGRHRRPGVLVPPSPKTKLLSPMLSPPPQVTAVAQTPTTALMVRLDLSLIERVPLYPPLDLDAALVGGHGFHEKNSSAIPPSSATPVKQVFVEEEVPTASSAPERCKGKGPCTPPMPYPGKTSVSGSKRKANDTEKEKAEGKRPKLEVQPESHKKPKHRTKVAEVKPNKDRKKRTKSSSKEEPQGPPSASASERRVTSSTADAPTVPVKGRVKTDEGKEGKVKRKKTEEGLNARTSRDPKAGDKPPEPVTVKKEPEVAPKTIVSPFTTSSTTVAAGPPAPAPSRSKQRNAVDTEPKRRKREQRPSGQPVAPPEPPKNQSDSPMRNTNHDRQTATAAVTGSSSSSSTAIAANAPTPAPTAPLTPRSLHSVAGSNSSPAPPDFRERPCIDLDERMHSSDYYLGEGKTLKREADKEGNKTTQAMKYLDAVLYFILTGHAMELELLPARTSFMLYRDSVDLIKFISSKFRSHQHISASGSTDNKLAVLSLRCQSLLYLKMYNMKRLELRECQKTLSEYQKATMTTAGHQGTGSASSLRPMPSPSVVAGAGLVGVATASGSVVGWHPKTTGTPSPMSPLPSPAGSVGSVESQSSGFSSGSELCNKGPQQTASGTAAPAAGGQQQQVVVSVPQPVYNAMRAQLGIYNYMYHSHDLWEQADVLTIRGRSQEFFSTLDRRCGCLTLHSTLSELVRYIRNGLHWLKGL